MPPVYLSHSEIDFSADVKSIGTDLRVKPKQPCWGLAGQLQGRGDGGGKQGRIPLHPQTCAALGLVLGQAHRASPELCSPSDRHSRAQGGELCVLLLPPTPRGGVSWGLACWAPALLSESPLSVNLLLHQDLQLEQLSCTMEQHSECL